MASAALLSSFGRRARVHPTLTRAAGSASPTASTATPSSIEPAPSTTAPLKWGGMAQCCAIDSVLEDPAAAAYDPATNTWRRLADPPAPWSGDDGAPIIARYGPDMLVWRHDRLGRYDVASNTWSDLGSPPQHQDNCASTAGPVSVGAVDGDSFFVWTGGCQAQHGAAFDLIAGTWSEIAAAPDGLREAVASETRLFGLLRGTTTQPSEFDVKTRAWSAPVDAPNSVGTYPSLFWTGSAVLAWAGSAGTDQRGGAIYSPA